MRYILLGLFAMLALLSALARRKGFSWRRVGGMALEGVKEALPVIRILLVIGVVTAVWREAGTIVAFVDYGIRLIRPRLFLLVAFLLSAVLSYALGTSFGVAGTAGVVFMTLARSGGVDPVVTAGVILSGVFFGDRGSPVSSTAFLVSHLTGTDLFSNVRRMMRMALAPLALCLIVYGLLSAVNPIRSADAAVLDAFRAAFSLHPVVFLPAAILLLLPLFRVPVLWSMALSIVSGVLAARFAQGMPWGEIVRGCFLGYTAPTDALGAVLNGGGMISMADSCLVIALACASSGIFKGAGMLAGLERGVEALADRVGAYTVLVLTALGSAAVFCNQIMPIIMGHTLLRPVYEKRGYSAERLAMDLENICITVPAFVPWAIICSVPLRLLGADYRSMAFAVFLYAVPILNGAARYLQYRKMRQSE